MIIMSFNKKNRTSLNLNDRTSIKISAYEKLEEKGGRGELGVGSWELGVGSWELGVGSIKCKSGKSYLNSATSRYLSRLEIDRSR
jgi:hypothetical protein